MKSPSLGHQGLRRSWAQVQTGVPQELHAEASIVFGHYKTQNPYLSLIDTVRPERRDEAWKYCLAAFVNTNAQNEILPCLAAAFAGRPNIGADEQFARVQEVMEVLVHRITVSSHRKRIPGLTVPVIDSFPSGLRQYLVNQLIGASEKDIRFQLETDYRTAGQVLEALQGMLGDLDELLASEKSNDDDVGRVLTRLDGILGDFLAAFAGKDLTKCSALKAVLKRVFRQLQISGNEAVARALGALFSSGLRNTAQFLDQDLSAILFDAAEQNEAEIAKLKEAILLAILPHRADGKRKSPHWSRLLAVWMSGQNEHGLKLREALIKSLFFYLPEPEQNAFLGGVLAMTKDNTHKTPQAFLGTLKLSPGRKIQAFLSFLPDAWTQRNAELLQVQSYQFPIHLPLGGKDLGHFSFNGAYFACLVQRGGLLRLFRAHRYSEGVNQDKYPAAQSKILLWAPVEGITPIDDPSQPLRTFHVQQEGSSCEIHITADAKCRKVKSQDAVIPAAELPPALRALRLLSCVQSAESESLYLGIRQISPTLLAHVSVQMDGDQVDVTDTGLVFLEHGSLHSVICRPDGSWAIAYADGRVTYWAD